MFGFVVFIHIAVCMLLSLIILMQSGRGGGLTEQFAAAESVFGAKTNTVLVKATTVLASIFIVTSLSLAFLSSKSNRSLISGKMTSKETSMPSAATATAGMPVTPGPAASAVQPETTNPSKTEAPTVPATPDTGEAKSAQQ